jgi:hypothetical protein
MVWLNIFDLLPFQKKRVTVFRYSSQMKLHYKSCSNTIFYLMQTKKKVGIEEPQPSTKIYKLPCVIKYNFKKSDRFVGFETTNDPYNCLLSYHQLRLNHFSLILHQVNAKD